MNEYEIVKKNGFVGFAQIYLSNCTVEPKTDDEIDIHVYAKLVKLDTRLGTTASEQLDWCIERTTRSDIIKVKIIFVNLFTLIFLEYRL